MTSLNITLRDGRSVHLRDAGIGDEAEYLQAFGRMGAHARYMRMMHVVRDPNVERVRAALASFPDEGIGLVATVPAGDGIDIVGSVVAIFSDDRTHCEFATSVAAEYGGVGLATALMTALIDEARRRGLKEMDGYVLAENQPMLKLARRLGFSVKYIAGDASVRHCRLALA
ncbi:MAG: GNAT family N-acetyltransferase [Ramlibacter sp.]|nr:GNAT family N-acetyltransferase [Ramlibacter sp.]